MNEPRPPKSSWRTKFANAWRGIGVGVRGQNSFLVHVPVAILVVVLAAILNLEMTRFCLLLLCIGAVVTAELFNSSLESMARAVTGQHNDDIRDSLDVASGAVLTISIFAAIVGAILLGFGIVAFFVGQ